MKHLEDRVTKSKVGRKVFFWVPEKTDKGLRERRAVSYKTIDLITGKIENVAVDQFNKILEEYKEYKEFKERGWKFGEIKIRFKSEEIAEEMIEKILQSDKWILFSTYMDMKVVRVRVGKIPLGY